MSRTSLHGLVVALGLAVAGVAAGCAAPDGDSGSSNAAASAEGAFQKDNVIRLLAITYKVERDKEFRSLRNTIASSYVPFGSTAPEDRVVSCASEEPDRASCNEKPDRNVWKRIVHDP